MKLKAKEQGNTYIIASNTFQTALSTIFNLGVQSCMSKRTMLKRMHIDNMACFPPQTMKKIWTVLKST